MNQGIVLCVKGTGVGDFYDYIADRTPCTILVSRLTRGGALVRPGLCEWRLARSFRQATEKEIAWLARRGIFLTETGHADVCKHGRFRALCHSGDGTPMPGDAVLCCHSAEGVAYSGGIAKDSTAGRVNYTSGRVRGGDE